MMICNSMVRDCMMSSKIWRSLWLLPLYRQIQGGCTHHLQFKIRHQRKFLWSFIMNQTMITILKSNNWWNSLNGNSNIWEKTEIHKPFQCQEKSKKNGKIIKYKIRLIGSVRFMASSLSNLTDNLAEGLPKSKCKDC